MWHTSHVSHSSTPETTEQLWDWGGTISNSILGGGACAPRHPCVVNFHTTYQVKWCASVPWQEYLFKCYVVPCTISQIAKYFSNICFSRKPDKLLVNLCLTLYFVIHNTISKNTNCKHHRHFFVAVVVSFNLPECLTCKNEHCRHFIKF